MLDQLNRLFDLKKWIEGHLVAGVATATAAGAAWVTANNVIETLAKFGVNVTIDADKFQGAVLVLIAGVAGALLNMARKKAVENTNTVDPE